jgi:hypothetical protein
MKVMYLLKSIPGFEGLYSIDERGNVWSERNQRFLKSRNGFFKLCKKGKEIDVSRKKLIDLIFNIHPKNFLIPGYEGFYSIDKMGNVYSDRSYKFLKSAIDKDGYQWVLLCIKNKRKIIHIHKLIALTFIPNPENKLYINHKDGNKQNNFVENLEWVTRSENDIHRCRVLHICQGEKHGMSKLKEKDVLEIREKYKRGMTKNEIAKIYNISRGQISNIILKKHWGYI